MAKRKLRSETDTPAMGREVEQDFEASHAVGAYGHEGTSNFEHGQWWVTCPCGGQWSAHDTQDGFGFEQVSEGDEDYHQDSYESNRRRNGEEKSWAVGDEVKVWTGLAGDNYNGQIGVITEMRKMRATGNIRYVVKTKFGEVYLGEGNLREPGGRRENSSEPAKKSCGFAVSVYGQHMVEENARERVREEGNRGVAKFVTKDGEITEAGWKQLNKDIERIERNSMRWLNDTFAGARSEGHDKHDDLIGTLWYDPTSERQMELLELASDKGRQERVDMTDWGYGGFTTAFDGVSDFGASVLGGAVTFFDVDEEF